MQKIIYYVSEITDGYIATSNLNEHIIVTAPNKEEALEKIQKAVFRYLLENGFQFKIAKAI